ncbi:MAG: hexokinase [Saprospiraceae bacterium]
MKSTDNFLRDHKLRAKDIDLDSLVSMFTEEMNRGLQGKKSSLHMIPTYFEVNNQFLTDVPVVAIDAGGTNFRTALIKFTKEGKLESGEIFNYRMPGLESEVSATVFFETIAGYIKPIADKSDCIGFCFSYPTEITPERDGKLLQFCKEVQAPEVVGKLIGKTLLETMGLSNKKIVLLNDTVATLLAGKSSAFGKSYDSFIGFILGTGSNTSYMEMNENIVKNYTLESGKSQIINIESGNFARAPRTDLDLEFDLSTIDPGMYSFEKMFSGAYFGGFCLTVLKAAAREDVFTSETAIKLNALETLTAVEVSNFSENVRITGNMLAENIANDDDLEKCQVLINCLIDRASKLVAGNLAAVVLKTGKGKSVGKPILITVEGTTYYKMHNLRNGIEGYLTRYLSGERNRYIEFTQVSHSSLIGAALGALTD